MIYLFLAIFLIIMVLFLCLTKSKKRILVVPDERANQTINSYNYYLQRIQNASRDFASELSKKQRSVILSNDGVSHQKCIYLVEEYNKSSEILESRLKNASDLINIRAFDTADSILSDLNDEVRYIEGLVKTLKSIEIEKDSFETVFKPVMEPKNPVSYFDGCNTKEDLIIRYKALSKVFHPDVKSGSKELFQQIQNQYTELIKKY